MILAATQGDPDEVLVHSVRRAVNLVNRAEQIELIGEEFAKESIDCRATVMLEHCSGPSSAKEPMIAWPPGRSARPRVDL